MPVIRKKIPGASVSHAAGVRMDDDMDVWSAMARMRMVDAPVATIGGRGCAGSR